MFPPEALTFFRGLAKNNDRDWFQPRKEIFETKVKAPMIELVEQINAELARFAPQYINDPKKAVYRIYRDTRFSSDKTPYKTHIAAIFPRRGSESKHAGPGLFFAVSHKEIGVAGGVYMPQPDELLKIRTWIAENHESFREIARGPKKLMGDLRGGSLSRIPKGFACEHPAADLIKMKQWYYGAELDPKLATTPKLLPELLKRFKAMVPVLEELAKPLAARKQTAMWPRLALTVLLAVLPAFSQDALGIVRKSLDRDISNFEHLKNYTYQQREEDRQYDKDGKLKKTDSETTEVLILAGRPYERLIARDDKPLSEKEARKQQEEMDKELAKRSQLSESERQKLEKRRAENRKFLNEIPDAFTFRLVGEEQVSGKPAWVIQAEPKPDYHAKDIRAKILTKLRGKIWVDKGEYQWVKVDADVLDTISLGFALFRIAPGGHLTFEQTRINDEVWLPAHAKVHADARLAYVKKMHAEIEINYSDYKKFQTESRIVATEAK